MREILLGRNVALYDSNAAYAYGIVILSGALQNNNGVPHVSPLCETWEFR
ncbi:MAG TPA: hypothetical protein VFO40_24955 [Chthoniobacterales bacterium]|nr:hypothetical protein [Chthoniobacterales bacterium]